MRRPVLRLSLTKSMLHTSLTVAASCSGTRSLTGRWALLRLRTARLAALYSAVDALVIHTGEVRAQHVVDAPIAEAPTCMRNLDDLVAELLRYDIGLGWIAIAVAGEPHKPAGAPFTQITLPDHDGHRRALGLRGYRFTPKAVLSAWMSRCASASSFLSLLFSASNSRRRLASGTSIPPYLARHL